MSTPSSSFTSTRSWCTSHISTRSAMVIPCPATKWELPSQYVSICLSAGRSTLVAASASAAALCCCWPSRGAMYFANTSPAAPRRSVVWCQSKALSTRARSRGSEGYQASPSRPIRPARCRRMVQLSGMEVPSSTRQGTFPRGLYSARYSGSLVPPLAMFTSRTSTGVREARQNSSVARDGWLIRSTNSRSRAIAPAPPPPQP
mmetsp:Transcript_18101/g.51066  ORF Transcript_18101/g.51066 Transcript_18101/m.51066 type:complete len:203 (+) Transcript_18101:263-871(+)